MKWDFEQSDFSGGEISERLQGQTLSDLYKRALKYASNMVITPQGDIMSRSGAETIAQQVGGTAKPVTHLPVTDGPWGSFMLEVGAGPLRMWDRYGRQICWGRRDYNFETKRQSWPTLDMYGEGFSKVSGSVVVDFNQQRFFLSSDGGGVAGSIITGFSLLNKNLPPGTNDHFQLSFKCAGEDVTVKVTCRSGVIVLNAAYSAGEHTVDFVPDLSGASTIGDFTIQFSCPGGAPGHVSSVWGITCFKNNAPLDDSGVYTALPVPQLARHAAFWTTGWQARRQFRFGANPANGDTFTVDGTVFTFNNVFQIGPNVLIGATIEATVANLTQAINFVFGLISTTGVPKYTAVVNPDNHYYIDITASAFGTAANAAAISATGGGAWWDASSVGNFLNGKNPEFYVVIVGSDRVQYLRWAGVTTHDVNGLWNAGDLSLIVRGKTYGNVPTNPPVVACVAYQSRLWLVDTAGGIHTTASGYGFGGDGSTAAAYKFDFETSLVPKATDAISLSLNSPPAIVRWLNVLRGLILGTSKKEMVFTMDAALAIDPATGQAFDIVDHSSYGSAEGLPALDVEDKIAFVPPGRKMLRLAGIRFEMYGGFKARDIGLLGEHLLRNGISTLTYLRSPTSRVVLGFDDGTAAIGLLDEKENCTWTRLSIPAALGTIYSVAPFDTDSGTELWVGTSLGVTLRFRTLESTVPVKKFNGVQFDLDAMDPPCLDGYVRAPIHGTTPATAYISGIPNALVGTNVYVIVNAQLFGPYVVAADGANPNYGKVVFPVAAGLRNVVIDRNGVSRPAEAYVGAMFPEHKFTTLPLEGGNPAGASQGLKSRIPQFYARFVDSYLPLIHGKRAAERGGADPTDLFAARVTGDVRYTELGFARGDVIDVVQDLPLRFEISAIFGGAQMNSV